MSDFGIPGIDTAINNLVSQAQAIQPTGDSQPEVQESPVEATEASEQQVEDTGNVDQTAVASETVEADEGTSDQADQRESDILEAYVNDGTGRKKISVDLSDRALVKKQLKLAAQAPSWKKKADTLEARLGSLEEKANNYDALDNILETEGEEGLMDRVLKSRGFENGLEGYIQRKIEEARFLETASQEEIDLFNERKEKETLAKRVERMEREQQQREERIANDKQEALVAERKALLTTSFSKHRFSADEVGKDQAYHLNSMIWKTANSVLDKLEKQGVNITPSIAEKEYSKARSLWNKTVNSKARKNTDKALKQKKAEAMENAQQASVRGQDNKSKGIKDLIANRDWENLFSRTKFKL